MNYGFILLWMIFFHIVDDFYLQGWLASAKQKSWWGKNAPEKLYEKDYIYALFIHSFSWTFMIMLPITYILNFNISWNFVTIFILNVYIHAMVDNMKANKKYINLWFDQIIHLLQIIVTSLIYFIPR